MNRRFGWISAVAAAAGLSLSAAPAVLEEPYGICAHVSRDVERPIAAQEFDSMREAGITHVRTDFDWHGVEDGPSAAECSLDLRAPR